MKYLLIICCAVSLFVSCTSYKCYLQADCSADKDFLFNKVSSILLKEDFMIKSKDSSIGYLQAETLPQRMPYTDLTITKFWIIKIIEGKLSAQAIIIKSVKETDGSNTLTNIFLDDKTDQSQKWYWNVRNELEKVCDNQIEFIEKKIE